MPRERMIDRQTGQRAKRSPDSPPKDDSHVAAKHRRLSPLSVGGPTFADRLRQAIDDEAKQQRISSLRALSQRGMGAYEAAAGNLQINIANRYLALALEADSAAEEIAARQRRGAQR